jgi:predicted CXXCH cytochrome family protein
VGYPLADDKDWWAPLYPPDNFKRPTGPLCDGCHSVDYDIATERVAEWNVGCERCHGPGSKHLAHPVAETILNPARFDYVHANDVCIQCHSQGRPLTNPIAGKYYDWPVGFHVLNLADYWRLEEHKLGETTFTHFADGTAHKNSMQGNDFVTSLMYARGVTCFSCHDPHGADHPAMVRTSGNGLCLTCHGTDTRTARTPRASNSTRIMRPPTRQRLHGLPYAEDRRNHRRRERPQSHVPLHLAGAEGDLEYSQRLQSLPRG